MTAFDDLVTIGRVVKPQGRHGEVLVDPISDRPERFPELKRVFVPAPGGGAREVQVSSCWPHKGKFVLKLDGVESIDDAERYRGLDLHIGEDALEALPAGSYYHHQLKALDVVDVSGRALGRVHDILKTGAADVLVIRGQGGETLLPLAEGFVETVDLPGKRMVVKVPELVGGGGERDARG